MSNPDANRTIKAIDNRIVVRPDDPQSTYAKSKLVIPDKYAKKTCRGVVIAHGTGRMPLSGVRQEMPVSVGDRVEWNNYCGTEIEFNDEKLIVIREPDLLAVIEKD